MSTYFRILALSLPIEVSSDDDVRGGGSDGGAAGGGATGSRKPVSADISLVWCPSCSIEASRGVDSSMFGALRVTGKETKMGEGANRGKLYVTVLKSYIRFYICRDC